MNSFDQVELNRLKNELLYLQLEKLQEENNRKFLEHIKPLTCPNRVFPL